VYTRPVLEEGTTRQSDTSPSGSSGHPPGYLPGPGPRVTDPAADLRAVIPPAPVAGPGVTVVSRAAAEAAWPQSG
jgi:hypothetical protein